jgi:hypothetical protein
MQMTNKTQSQMIGTALPSDQPSERRTYSTIGGIHRPGSGCAEVHVCCCGRVCALCEDWRPARETNHGIMPCAGD